MKDFVAKAEIVLYKPGQSIKGTVLDINPSRILVDLPGGNTGMITKREFGGSLENFEGLDVGGEIESVVLDSENEQGLVVLSIRRASQDMAWAELNMFFEEERNFKVKIAEANKGGLMAKYKGLKCFLPVSQLTPANYPRVEGADSGQILTKLQEHIGKEFVVRVLNLSREDGKVIISEKAAQEEIARKTLENLAIGDKVEGHVSGVVKFGIFVTFGGVEGLVHVSEMDWGHVSNPGKNYSVGDTVEVLIIGKDGDKLSFSIKQLKEDPWIQHAQQYAQDQEVTGKIVRWNDNGVFVEVAKDVQGLFSLDQFEVERGSELVGKIKEGEELTGKILVVNTDAHRLELQKV